MPKNRRKLTGEEMMVFVIQLREWWKTLDKAERRLMNELVFRVPEKEAPRPARKDKPESHVRQLLETL